MATTPDQSSAAAVLAAAEAELRDWFAAHPQATLYEMEVATERQLARVRAALVGELVASAGATPERPACPACGGPMQQAGMQERTLVLPHDEPLTVRGARYRCPACGAGLFPPR